MTVNNFEKMLKKAKYVTVSISDNRHITCIRRAGPIKSVTIPVEQFNFLVSQGFNVTLEKIVSDNGIVIKVPEQETVQEVIEVGKETLQQEEQTSFGSFDEPSLVKVDSTNPIIVRTYNSDENSLSILSKEEYEEYSRNELLEYLNLLPSNFLPEVIRNEIAPENYQSRNLSKKRCIQIIEQTFLSE